MDAAPDLVILGNLLVDDIVLRDGTTLMGEPGGALLHAALAARLWSARVGLVSVVGTDYPAAALEALADRGVDLSGVRRLGRPGGRAWLLYERDTRRVIHHLGCPSHDDVSPLPDDVPAAFRTGRAFHLAPMPIERQHLLAQSLADRPFLSLDPYDLLRDDTLAAWSRVLAHVDAFFPSRDEILTTLPADDLVRRLASGRLGLIALKAGAEGGRLVDLSSGDALDWASRTHRVVDATGAGDAFAGGFLAGLLLHGDRPRAIEQGIVAASFAVEDWGARGLLAATPAHAAARQAEWFGAMAVAEGAPA
jgi:ribokinase